mmetsp:Transcript_4898/g.8712  ORF Transcript_4898/g.8712 Transcript_4898/m.8712 type:complete len:231 (-) Transcript_4898:498-1190(-)
MGSSGDKSSLAGGLQMGLSIEIYFLKGKTTLIGLLFFWFIDSSSSSSLLKNNNNNKNCGAALCFHSFNYCRKVEGGGGHVSSHNFPPQALKHLFNVLLRVQVSAGRLALSREQLSDSLQQTQHRCPRREGDDKSLLRRGRQRLEHLPQLWWRVVDDDVEARHSVIRSAEALQVLGLEDRRDCLWLASRCNLEPPAGLLHHGARYVACTHLGPLECERNGERPGPATRVTH